jgi:PilZ domain-containing protein
VGARRHERFESHLTIKLDHGDGVMRNVSASGVYFVTDVDVEPGSCLTFTLEFSGLEIGAVSARCKARVMRVEPEGTLKGVAAAFETIQFERITKQAG